MSGQRGQFLHNDSFGSLRLGLCTLLTVMFGSQSLPHTPFESSVPRTSLFPGLLLLAIARTDPFLRREEMEVLFTFLAERYERRSVMISSNLVFSKWDQIFKDPMTTMAAVDRLVHHAIILEFDNGSVRADEAKNKPRKDDK